MTDKQINTYFGEAVNYADPDAFASDVALALLDPYAPDQQPDAALFDQLRILWHVACDPFRDFLALVGLSQTECSIRFCIPLRTVQGWSGVSRSSPPYLRLMIAELTGVLRVRD